VTETRERPRTIPLRSICHARSGDKGNLANIGVVCDSEVHHKWLQEHLTEAVVAAYFRPLGVSKVRRYELPNIRALNFVMETAFGGGASRSLRMDSQGKALATALLELEISAPP
jgi:hypothetical protein